jgi:hypothetical protein
MDKLSLLLIPFSKLLLSLLTYLVQFRLIKSVLLWIISTAPVISPLPKEPSHEFIEKVRAQGISDRPRCLLNVLEKRCLCESLNKLIELLLQEILILLLGR